MFNGYNETPLISYNEFDQEREKKGENVSKWSFMHEPGAQPTTGNCQTEFWSGKPSFLGIPHISKCNCSSCYPSTEIQSYQSESPRHRPWLPRSFPVPYNSAGELCKLPGCHQWDNVGVPNQSFPDGNVQYLHQAEGTHPFYRHYANSMLTELNQRGLITSVKDSDLAKQKQKVDGQNGTRQPVFCDPGYNYPKNLEKRIDNRNSRDSNKKYSNVDPYRHSYSVDQHMSRLPVVEPHIKAVPSNLNENRVPSTGHRNVKKNTPHSAINQEYNDPEKVVFRDANLEKTQRAAYQSAMGREGPVPENFLYPFQKAVDFKNTGIIDHPSYNLHEQETQKLLLENIRHADFSRNMSDAIKRNTQPPATDGRKDCAMGQSPASKYIDLENEKNSCGGFYPKEFGGDKLTRTEPETPSCFHSSGDLIKSENSFPRSTLIFNERFPEKMQSAFPYQNNPSDYRNYLRSDYPYQGYSAQGLYDYSAVPQFQEVNQYGLRQQQQQQQLPIRVVDQFMQNKNVIFNSPYQQPGNPDKIPQQIYPEKSQVNSSSPEAHLEEVKRNDYLETIKTKEMNKNVNSKISPLRLLRKKKFVGQSGAEPMPIVSTPSSAPALDVRKFWSTWAEEEEENVAPTQMVVLDCQNIDAEQAKLLHLCESDSFRAVNLQEDSIVALKDSEPGAQLIQEVKNSEQITVVKDSVVGKHEEVIEQEETPVIRKPDQSVQREIAAESNNENQQSVVRNEITETASHKVSSDILVKADQKPCKRGRSSASQEGKDTVRHKKVDVEKEREKANGLDKWTEKKFDFLKRAEESRAAEKLKHEEEKKKIFEKRLTFQQGTHSELKKIKVQRPVEEKEPSEPKIKEKVSEWLSSLDDNSQSTSPAVSDADLPDLPTSEYRRNKFLDYSDRKSILSQFQNESAYVKDSDRHEKVIGGSAHKSSSEVEEIKKEQAIKLEPTNATRSLGSDKLGKNEGDLCLINSQKLNDGTGFEVEDIMKKISEINVGSPQIDEVKTLSKLDTVKRIKKPKKSKKLERKEEMKERSDNLAVENISVSKPTIKFSIQKSHDLKISFKVLNSSNNSNNSSNKYEVSEMDEEIEREEVERTDNPEDSASNSTEIITLRLQSYQRDALHDDRNHRQSKKRNGDSKENERRFRRNKIPVEKNPVLKIKKNRCMLQEKEEEPLGRESAPDDALNLFGANSDDFQVQETVESAKIKLTFKRHKTSCETEYTISKKCVGKLLEEGLDSGEAQYFAHWETVKKKSGRRKDGEKSAEPSVESFNTNQEPTETDNVVCDDSGSNSILKEGSVESTTPEEDSRNVELNTEEENCISNLTEKLTFPISPETQSDAHFTVSLPEKKAEVLCNDEENFAGTNPNDKEKETKEDEDSKILEDEEDSKMVEKDEDSKIFEKNEDSKGLKDDEDSNMLEEDEDSKMLGKDEDFSFGAVEMERPLEEGDPEEISLDFNWDISTKKTVGSAELNKSDEEKLMMFSTNETNHSENESSCKSNSDKDVDETWVPVAHTAAEDGNKYDISKNSLATNFLISNEYGPEDCNRNEIEIDKNHRTDVIVGSESNEECAKENSSNHVAFGNVISSGELDQSVNECSEQQEIENQNPGALSENLNSVNIVKSYGESEEVNSEEEQSEALSLSEPMGDGTSPPESLLVTPVLLSPLSQTLDNTESTELSKQLLEKSQDVLTETGVNSFEVFDSNVSSDQVEGDSKSETELEEGEIVDDSSEEQNERQIENSCQDVGVDISTEMANKEENKSSTFSSILKFENPRKITRRNTLLLEVPEDIERTKESQKRLGYKAKSCPPLLEFGEVETPLFDISVEDIPLPPGDPPPENCFDLVDYLKKARINTKEKSNESNIALPLPQTQTSGNMIPSVHQSPIKHSDLQISPSQPKPEDSQQFSSLKNLKLKFSSSEPKNFKFDKSEIEESFECEKNKKTEKGIEEKSGDLIQLLMSLDTLDLDEEMQQKDVSEEEAKQVHKPDLIEEKKEKVAATETSLTNSGLISGSEETNAMERPSHLKESDAGAATEKVNEVNANNTEHIQEQNYDKTESEDFEPQLANINFSSSPVELTAEDVDFEEVDLKTVEMIDEPITGNFQNSNRESSNCIREEFYECEDIPTSEDLPNGDGDAEVEKVSDDDKFRNIMQNCLDNAKKFLNVDKLKLFSCSVDDLLELDCEGPDSNPAEKEPDKSTNHFSRDVLLASCEETVTDDLGLSENFQPTDMSMDFEPSFGIDAPHNLCSEILPVNNWPYLEEEVPASPTKSKPEDSNLIPIEGSETKSREFNGLTDESEDQQEVPLRSQKSDGRDGFDMPNRNKTKRTFSSGDESGNSKRVKRSLTYEAKTSPRSPTVPRRNTIESFARDLLTYEKKDFKKEVIKPKNGIDKIENICKKNGSLKCSLSLEKMSNKNRHEAVKPVDCGLPHGKNFEKLEEVVKKTAAWQPKVMLSRILDSENPVKNKSCAIEREKITCVKASEALLVSKPRDSFARHAEKRQKLDSFDSKNVLEKLKYSGRKSDDLDHNANEDRKEVAQTPFGLLRGETTLKKSELSREREIDSIYSTLRMDSKGFSLVREVSKRKKSRFRNLYAKERSGHDSKITKDSFAQSGVPDITAAVDEESILSELLKDCDSSKGSTVSDFRARSIKHVDEKTRRKSSEKINLEKNRKSSMSDASPDRIRDKITGKSSSSCDETKTQKTKEESEHRTSDGKKYRSCHKHRKEKSESRSSHKHGRHNRHRSSSSSERKERSPDRKRHSRESRKKNSEVGKEKPGYREHRSVDPWVCQVCGFNDASERISHVKSHPFHCQSCHLAFGEETYFVSHLTKKHKDIRNQHHCLLCELSFDTEKQYQAHLETREHTHLESVEKNTINTLFTLLTGQPCSVLGHVEMKPEWLPNQPGTVHFYHQATPLSLALQYLKVHHDLTSYSTVSSAHPN